MYVYIQCMHSCVNACMYVNMYVCMYICLSVCLCACIHAFNHECMHVSTYARMQAPPGPSSAPSPSIPRLPGGRSNALARLPSRDGKRACDFDLRADADDDVMIQLRWCDDDNDVKM